MKAFDELSGKGAKYASALAFAGCVTTLVTLVLHDHQRLPGKIASHFDGSGIANGWSDSSSLTVFVLAIGLGVPAFVIALMPEQQTICRPISPPLPKP